LRAALALACLAWVRTDAQIALPGVQVPAVPVQVPVPVPALPGAVDAVVGAGQTAIAGAGNRLNALTDARRVAAAALIRGNRVLLEADPDGEPIRRAELLAYAPTPAALQAALGAGFQVVRRLPLTELDTELVVLRAPANLNTRRSLARLRALDRQGSYDYNHLYLGSASSPPEPATPAAQPQPLAPAAAAAVRIGLIDGGVDGGHPDFAAVDLVSGGCDGQLHPSAHGTAVASLLVAASTFMSGPPVVLQAMDVYCGQPDGGGVDALAEAFTALVRAQVSVINISLVGPRNLPLELLVRAVQRRGVLVVAAVGNDGPAARPLYPAALPGVIAVTAVDGKRRVLAEACRGEHVQFAAPGADIVAADLAHGRTAVRGTSFAAPIVTGLLARMLAEPHADAESALSQLARQAVDLGKPGRDAVYGWGLVGASLPLAAMPTR
jgi:hypothetical protein